MCPPGEGAERRISTILGRRTNISVLCQNHQTNPGLYSRPTCGGVVFFLQRSHIISVGVVEPTFYSNSGVVKYRSAVSGSTVTTVLPLPSFFARRMAAATLVPLEMPHIRPSSRARSLAV